ncbi:hypothetical protein BDR07DRAFT_487095 [Suillus spraguei]|nr:hypothetical protein BDR07DRAFT_487095 [Suillus spraguei]
MSLVVIALISVNVLGGVDRLEHEFMACDRHLVFEYVLYMPYERFIRYDYFKYRSNSFVYCLISGVQFSPSTVN